jgi:uncharacterized membrane protein YdjX (TVP38/TMEM64 family)
MTSESDLPVPPAEPSPATPAAPLWPRLMLGGVMLGAVAAFLVFGRGVELEALRANREALLAFTQRNFAAMLLGAALAYALATALSLPVGVLLTLACGFLFGRWVGTGVVVLAASAGATLAFLAARYLFADAARRRMGPRLQAIARGFEADAFNYLLFLRLVPLFPFWLVNLAPALTPVKARTFFAATLVGIVPGTFVYANLGTSLARIDSPRDLVSGTTLAALALLGVLSLVPIVLRKLRTRTPAHG